jgi:hypothetical protein
MFGRKKKLQVQGITHHTYEVELLRISMELQSIGMNEVKFTKVSDGDSAGIDISGKFFNSTEFKIISSMRNLPKSV